MTEDEKDRPHVGDLISFFRWIRGWSQARLAKRTGLYKSQISRYEAGEETPRPANFQRITSAVGVPLELVDFIHWCLRLILQALGMGKAVEVPERAETRTRVGDAVDRTLSLARAELALLRSTPPAAQPGPPTAVDHQRVERLWERLRSYPGPKQRLLIEGGQAYRDWLLCLRICAASEEAASAEPARAVELAELALHVARHVPGTEGWRSRLMGRCAGFLANAQRAGSDLRGAEATFARAWRLWRAGEDEAGLLSEAYLFHQEASLRGAQRRFREALRLHNEALRKARPEEKGMILLNKAGTLQEMGDHETALEALGQAAEAIDGRREPRLRFGVQFNRAANLCRMNRAAEAARLVPEVRELVERLPQDREMDLVRTRWLEGNVAAGLGRREEARAALEQVRRDFDRLEIPYDFAMASLDLALVYREEGRFAEIKSLAGEMLEIFQAQGVHREPVAAVLLFREAAEKEQVTTELVRRLQDYLGKVRSQPQLCFKP